MLNLVNFYLSFFCSVYKKIVIFKILSNTTTVSGFDREFNATIKHCSLMCHGPKKKSGRVALKESGTYWVRERIQNRHLQNIKIVL